MSRHRRRPRRKHRFPASPMARWPLPSNCRCVVCFVVVACQYTTICNVRMKGVLTGSRSLTKKTKWKLSQMKPRFVDMSNFASVERFTAWIWNPACYSESQSHYSFLYVQRGVCVITLHTSFVQHTAETGMRFLPLCCRLVRTPSP
jgi:hypothetical protein